MTEDQFNSLQAQLNQISSQLKAQDKRINAQQAELENINSQFFGPFYTDLITRTDDLEYTVREGQVVSGISHDRIRAEIALLKMNLEQKAASAAAPEGRLRDRSEEIPKARE